MGQRTLAERTRSAEARTGALTKHRNAALLERTALLAQLSHYWPSYLTKRKKGPDYILVMRNPHARDAPELSWLLFRADMPLFQHLEVRDNESEPITHDQRLAVLREGL